MDHDIVLVHVRELFVPSLSAGEGIADSALDSVPGVDRDLGRNFLRGVRANGSTGSGVRTFGALTDDDEIDLAGIGQRAGDSGEQFRGTQVHRMAQPEAHLEDHSALEHAGRHGRISAGTEEDGIMSTQRFELFVGKRLAGLVVALGTDLVVGELELDWLAGHLDGAFEDFEAFGDDLVADSISGHDCD